MSRWVWSVWLVIVVASFAVLEAFGLADKRADTTLSAQVWRARQIVVVRFLIGGVLGWLTWHLGSPLDASTGGWDDVVAIMLGAGTGAALQYKGRHGS